MLAWRICAYVIVASSLLLSLGNPVGADVSCRDENGEPVDWYIGYKFPMLDGNNNFGAGLAYSFVTSKDVEEEDDKISARTDDSSLKIFGYKFRDLLLKHLGYKADKTSRIAPKRRYSKAPGNESTWVVSEYAISDPQSILMQTMAPVFSRKNSNINSIFYNDNPGDSYEIELDTDDESEDDSGYEIPITRSKRKKPRKLKKKRSSSSNPHAHAKGILLMDEDSMNGVWLTHSVPRFPDMRGAELKYPTNAIYYGQSFMCINFKVEDSAEKLVDHLINMRVLVYDTLIGDKLVKMIPGLADLAADHKIAAKPTLSQMITTRGGQVLHLFSKSLAMNNDLYSGWIDEELGADLYVETWRNGNGNPLDSFCPTGNYHVNNILDLKYNDDLQWGYSKDHGKWAITTERDDGIVCMGDSNRMASQFKRGGGAVCMKCNTCWEIFSNTIQGVEPCPKDSHRIGTKEPKDARATLDAIKQLLKI